MRRRQSSEGSYSITGEGVNSSSVNLGAAISKALTLAGRIQRTMSEGEERSLYIRRLGEEVAARVDVTPSLITAQVLVRSLR